MYMNVLYVYIIFALWKSTLDVYAGYYIVMENHWTFTLSRVRIRRLTSPLGPYGMDPHSFNGERCQIARCYQ
jgi:hypothetical protein